MIPPGYKQTEVGVIPVDWESVKAGDIGRFRGGNGFPLRFQGETASGYPFYKVSDMNNEGNDTFMFDSNNWISEGARKQLGATAFPTDTIIFAKVGAAVFLERKKILTKPSCIDNNLCGLVLDKSRTHVRFVHYSLLNIKFGSLVSTTALPSLSGTVLSQITCALPPLPEQRAIATALSDVDALLAALAQLIAKKRDLKQAAMQQLLTGQTRLPGFHGEWEVKRLGAIAEMGSGGTPPSSVSAYYDGNIPWVSISDMTKGGKIILSTDRNLTNEGFVNSAAQMFPIGTVLYAMYASLGECSIAGIPLCSSQAILGIRPKDKLNGEFLYYFLNSLKAIVKTLGQQGTQANLNKGMVQNPNFSPTPRRTNRHRHGSLRHRPGAGRPGAASGEDPRPQAGHDAGTPHREDALALGRFSH
jgi:type I restriction enzyme, S subunit